MCAENNDPLNASSGDTSATSSAATAATSDAWISSRFEPRCSTVKSGCSASVVAIDHAFLSYDAVPETLRRSNLGRLVVGAPVDVSAARGLHE